MSEVKQIYKNMISILKDVGSISKDKKNVTQGYSFRGIDDMYNALHDLFALHETFITSEVLSETREERKTQKGGTLLYTILDVKFTCWAMDGSSVFSTMKGEAMDSGDKASNKAMSTALKYFLMQTFLIPTQEKLDTEYDDPKPTHKPESKGKLTQKQEVDNKLKELPAYIQEGMKLQKLNYKQIVDLCEMYTWDNDKIKEHVDMMANGGSK